MAVTRLGAGAGGMTTGTAVTYDSPNVATSDASTVAVVSVAISVSSNSTGTTCAVTYGGVAMTQLALTLLGSSTNRNARGLYYLFNPGTGVKSVVATPAGAATKAGLISQCVVFAGVGSVGAAQTASATTHAPTSAADGYVVRVLVNGAALSSPNQTNEYLNGQSVGGVGDYAVTQSAAGTGSTISFTSSGTATTPGSSAMSLLPVAPMSALQDAFDTKDTAKWSWGAGVGVSGGRAQIPLPGSTGSGAWTVATYGLIGGEVTIQLAQPTADGDADDWPFHHFGVGSAQWSAGNYYYFRCMRNSTTGIWSLAARARTPAVPVATDFSSTTISRQPYWFRIRESSGTVYFDYGTDGLNWTNIHSRATEAGFSLDAVYVGWTAGTGSVLTDEVLWDNVNLPPSASAADFFAMF
jgi:hypothetical protein